MAMRIALDTNVLAYAEGVGDASRRDMSLALLANLDPASVLLPAQALGELFNVLTRRIGRSAEVSRASVEDWRGSSICQPTTAELMTTAVDLATRHRLAIWDAVILSAAAEARCDYLLSEDMQDGFVWRGVMIVNPFGAKVPDTLARLLSQCPSQSLSSIPALVGCRCWGRSGRGR